MSIRRPRAVMSSWRPPAVMSSWRPPAVMSIQRPRAVMSIQRPRAVMSIRRAIPVLLLFALAVPARAHASSLVFVRPSDGNVWLAAPNGTQQFQVTHDGAAADPYYSPTQSRDGTIAVARGRGTRGRLFRLDRLGSRLNAAFGVASAPAIFDPVISPDGRQIALWTGVAGGGAPCYVDFSCFEVVSADQGIQLSRPAWMTLQNPAWLGNARLMLFNAGGTVSYADLGRSGFSPWFSWGDYFGAAGSGQWMEGAASHDGRMLALVAHDENAGRFAIQLFTGPANVARVALGGYRPALRRCVLTAPDGGSGADPRNPGAPAFRNLSFSPHGTALAYGFKGSIYVATLASCRSTRVLARAVDPSWGPQSVTPPVLSLSATPVKTIAALLLGLRVTVALNTPGTVALTLKRDRQTIAHARVRLRFRGRRAVVVLKPAPAVARRLSRLAKLRATLTASVVGFPRPVQMVRLTLTRR